MQVRWHAPGRVNLIGEHTDYNEGYVLPFAVPWGVTATVARRADNIVAVSSTLRPGEVLEDPDSGWGAYAAGVVWAFREGGHKIGGVAIHLDSDLPEGAGLSSSAALEAAVAGAINDLDGLGLTRAELARIAQRAENDFVGAPTGILDQSASLLCRDGRVLLLDTRDLSSEQVPFDGSVLIVDTGVRHAHAGGEYGVRRRECEHAAALLRLPSLRDAGDHEWSRLEDPVLCRRVRHIVTENARVLETVERLKAGKTAEIGPLLTASHLSLRDDYEVSWTEADVAVDAANEAGAYGARMVGGGFGGSIIALVPEASAVQKAITDAFAARGWAAPRFLTAAASPGARAISAR